MNLIVSFVGDSCYDIFHGGKSRNQLNGFPVLTGTQVQKTSIGMLGNVVSLFKLLASLYEINLKSTTVTRINCEKHYYVDEPFKRIIFRDDPRFEPLPLSSSSDIFDSQYDLSFLVDYKKGAVTPEIIRKTFETSKKIIFTTKNIENCALIPSILGTLRSAPEIYLLLNNEEALSLSYHYEQFCTMVRACKFLLVTQGSRGVEICQLIEKFLIRNPIPTQPVENPIDTTCAGDIFLTCFGFYLKLFEVSKPSHLLMWNATNAAMKWAAESTKYLGMWLPTKEEAKNFIQKESLF